MRLAGVDVFVWLIIFVMVAVAKAWSKSQKQIDDDSSTSDEEAPPIAPVQRRVTPREGIRPQLQPRKLSGQPSRVAPVPRAVQPAQRTIPRTAARPVGSPAPREGWRIDPEQIRRFVEQLSGQPRPAGRGQPQATSQPPVAPPPVPKAPPPAPIPEPEPVATAAETKPTVPATTSRAAQWAEALRDKQNIRNIIISAEIIGPPKAV